MALYKSVYYYYYYVKIGKQLRRRRQQLQADASMTASISKTDVVIHVHYIRNYNAVSMHALEKVPLRNI